MSLVTFDKVTKDFDGTRALDQITTEIQAQRVVGLIGLNGGGKTTFLRHIVGLMLPTMGRIHTFGKPTDKLGSEEFSRIGFVHQEHQFLEWMSVWEHIHYVSSFYPHWDGDLEKQLLGDFDLDPNTIVGKLSPGNTQKMAIILAVCHSPDLLILDEPASALDPIVRKRFLEFLLDVIGQRTQAIIISSHVLTDIEKVVDHILSLHQGRMVVDSDLDVLLESYSEWVIQSGDRPMPEAWDADFILKAEVDGDQARLIVDRSSSEAERFAHNAGLNITQNPMNLDRIFEFLIGEV